jgi:hypothetical protein
MASTLVQNITLGQTGRIVSRLRDASDLMACGFMALKYEKKLMLSSRISEAHSVY